MERKPFFHVPVIVLVIFLFSSCDKIGDCQDAGGRWVEEIDECECTYEDRGNYSIHITEEELKACVKPRSKKSAEKPVEY